MSNTHRLKTWPSYYRSVETGAKTFELRRDDRHFEVGDTLVLQEWSPLSERYTGRELTRVVTFILSKEQISDIIEDIDLGDHVILGIVHPGLKHTLVGAREWVARLGKNDTERVASITILLALLAAMTVVSVILTAVAPGVVVSVLLGIIIGARLINTLPW